MINWKVRIRNKAFWMALIPALLLLAQTTAALFGCELELDAVSGKILAVVNQLFALLAILGIVNDPTTSGLRDSTNAMEYQVPKAEAALRE